MLTGMPPHCSQAETKVASGDDYGYGHDGWFGIRLAGHPMHGGWGYGGQMIYIVPNLGLTVTMSSDEGAPLGAQRL